MSRDGEPTRIIRVVLEDDVWTAIDDYLGPGESRRFRYRGAGYTVTVGERSASG
jgi:hypothetical protein